MDSRNTPPATCEAMWQAVERELLIDICPDAWVRWKGSRAQLEAEGLIPEGTDWPARAGSVSWTAGRYAYQLNRCRPDGLKGPMRQWIEGDYWSVTSSVVGREDSCFDLDVKRKARELEGAIYRASVAGRLELDAQWDRLREARRDKAFQCLKDLLVPAPKKHGRPAKAGPVAALSPSISASGRA